VKNLLVLSGAVASTLYLFVTLAGATEERTARAGIGKTSLLVAGEPFFPVMMLDQCNAAATKRAHRLGVNLVINESCRSASARRQLSALHARQLGVLPIEARGVRGLRLAGWTFPDEPENNGWTPAKLASSFHYRRGSADGLLSFVTTTSAFLGAPYGKPNIKPATIGAIARLADVAGFDLYPLNHCQHDLTQVYDAQRAFIALAGSMPTFQWIETGALDSTYCGGFSMSAAQLTAEAWLAVAGGARGIGFFTQTLSPAAAFSVAAPVQRAIAHFGSMAGAVRPGLVGRTISSGADSPAVKVLARSSEDATYVFAVSGSNSERVRVQIRVPQLRDGTLRVFGEKRTVTVSNHNFVDEVAPLGVHVYVQSR
jgi:hypothetical protein